MNIEKHDCMYTLQSAPSFVSSYCDHLQFPHFCFILTGEEDEAKTPSGIDVPACGEEEEEEDGDGDTPTILPTSHEVMADTERGQEASAERGKNLPRTLLTKLVLESSQKTPKPNWATTSRFKASPLGKAMRVELLWEEDVRART